MDFDVDIEEPGGDVNGDVIITILYGVDILAVDGVFCFFLKCTSHGTTTVHSGRPLMLTMLWC